MMRLSLALFSLLCLTSTLWAETLPVPRIVVSIKPLHSLVAGVMQGVGEPQLLVKAGGSPHGYVMRPSEAKALANAQLVVWVGHELESFLEKPLSTLGQHARQLELADLLQSQLLPLREGGAWDTHAHEDHHSEDHHGNHDRPAVKEEHYEDQEHNLHLWLDPLLAKQIVTLTSAALSDIDPGRQDIYQRNALQLTERLDQLHLQLQQRLKPVQTTPYIVFHDAYQYFEAAYELNAVGSITIDPERKAGVRRIREIREKIRQLNARCVFSEPQFESRMVATVIEGTGAGTGILDPLGADLQEGPEAYFQLMTRLADNLYEGLK